MSIAIITDSSAGISVESAQKEGIFVARMPLSINGKEYMEATNISRNDVISAMRQGQTVQTSQPPVGQLMLLIDELLKEHDSCLYIPISSKLSGSYQTAVSIAQDYNGRLVVVDALQVSAPLYATVVEAKQLADNGMSAEAIKSLIESEQFMDAALIPEDIVYLKRGGRISSAAAAVANLLKIVPVLRVFDGSIDLADKVRTHKKAVKTGIELILKDLNHEDYNIFVLNGDCDDKLYAATVKEVESIIQGKIIQREIYPIVLAHTGPGTIAVAIRKKLLKGSTK